MSLFTKGDGKIIEERKMEVVYVSPPQTPSSVPEEGSSPQASYQSDNRNLRSYLSDAVPKAADEPDARNSEVLNAVSMLNREKASAIQLNQKLQQELELLRKEHSSAHQGFSFLFVLLVGILGILVGYLVKT